MQSGGRRFRIRRPPPEVLCGEQFVINRTARKRQAANLFAACVNNWWRLWQGRLYEASADLNGIRCKCIIQLYLDFARGPVTIRFVDRTIVEAHYRKPPF